MSDDKVAEYLSNRREMVRIEPDEVIAHMMGVDDYDREEVERLWSCRPASFTKRFWECTLCGAVVTDEGVVKHSSWHELDQK